MAGSSHTLRFMLDGARVSVTEPHPTTTVLDYLRDTGRRGTKEGCAEGDCGACTVVLGERDAANRRVIYRAVNSCIRFLPTLDGRELITVESLRQPSGELHPVQQSMVDNHASQCGFCTPGFVMSLFALYLNRSGAEREHVLEALAGNLCRCTGYRPIIDAGMRQWSYPAPLNWSREESQSAARLEGLDSVSRDGGRGASLDYAGYWAPRSLEELAGALDAQPDAVLLAGGTDVGLWVTKQLRELPALVYLGDVPELSRIEARAHELMIGAAVTLTDAWPALTQRFPALQEQAARFASPPIRNSATLCGNLANGSPIGDSIPVMLALGAELELRRGADVRRVALEDFYLGYMKNALRKGEFVSAVAIPLPADAQVLASYKVSKRIDQDISAVCATFCIRVAGEQVLGARLAFGGLAGIASRAHHAERALAAHGWSLAGVEAASAALASDFKPLSDLRASSAYRLRAAGNLLRRCFLEAQRKPIAMRTHDALQGAPP
ncbi:MAG TPA: xanthine dehydrogenase small subunit [Steroidobacteraceae bacterium]